MHRLMFASLLEASTLALLVFVAVPLKHWAGVPEGSAILGPLHGAAFLYYLWTVFDTVSDGGWNRKEVMRVVVVAFIPLAGFFNVEFLRRKIARA